MIPPFGWEQWLRVGYRIAIDSSPRKALFTPFSLSLVHSHPDEERWVPKAPRIEQAFHKTFYHSGIKYQRERTNSYTVMTRC